MLFHVVYSLPENDVCVGSAPDQHNRTFSSFEEAKADAIDDLERWIEKIEGGIERLKAAKSVKDLNDDA